MKRIGLVFTALLFASVAAFGQGTPLEGEWVSMSPRTRGLTKVVIAAEARGYSVEAWGRCHPTDCAWGRRLLTPVGEDVEDTSFDSGFAEWTPPFAIKYLMFSIDKRMLRVETVTIFRDRSGRSSYRIVEFLRRADGSSDQ